MMTCLRWILGYTRLEIWHKIAASLQNDVFAQRYALVVVHATIGVDSSVIHVLWVYNK